MLKILNINVEDNVKFQITNSEPIRVEDEYGGLKYNKEQQGTLKFHIQITALQEALKL